jgi:Trypsin-co-occurring domain 1
MLAAASGGSSRPDRRIVPVTFGEAKIFVEALTPEGAQGVQTISGLLDVPQSFTNVAKGIGEVSSALLAAIKAAAPTELEVEFGIDLKVESDGLFALIVKGEASGSMKVTLKWENTDSPA